MPRLQPRHVYLPAGVSVIFRLLLLTMPEPVARASNAPGAIAALAEPAPGRAKLDKRERTAATADEKMAELPKEFLAFDISRPFGSRRKQFDSEKWARFCEASRVGGRQMVVVQARGSSTSSPYADLLLKGARDAGLRTAAYVFLNFHYGTPSGDQQVQAALNAVGSEAKHLEFMVVDVESGAAGGMTQAERVNRIGQAVDAVAKARLRPVIYAKNTGGRRGEWTDLTGNATDFSYLPLWVPRYDLRPTLESDGHSGGGWRSFGGWGERHGKQFADQSLTSAPYGLDADDNIFSRSVAEGPKRARPYTVTPLVDVVKAKAKRDKKTGEVVQAVKLVNKSRSPIVGPLSVVLDNLTDHSPLANGTGDAEEKGTPYVRIASKVLAPGGSIHTELRFAPTTSAPPSYEAEVRAGSGDL